MYLVIALSKILSIWDCLCGVSVTECYFFLIIQKNFDFIFLLCFCLNKNKIIWFFIAEMAEGNGELIDEVANIKSDDRGDGQRTDDYPKLLEYGLDKKVIILI